METIQLRNSVTVSVGTSQDARIGTSRLYIDQTSRIYTFFAMPILPSGSVVTNAKLRVIPGSTNNTSTTLTVHKVSSAFDPGSLTWANQPTVGAQVATQTHAFNALWEFDVTTHVAAILAGEAWYGWRITSNAVNTLDHWVYGSDTPYQLALDIEYEPPPQKPINLSPNSNSLVTAAKPVLAWTTPGATNGAQQFQFQVQVDDASDFATPTYDSGTQSGTASTFDLGGTAMTALTNGQSRYWRVRVRNQANVWGPWSDAAQWTYRLMAAVTITVPAATTNDPTPLITWTYSGTQVAKQIIVEEAAPVTGVWSVVHDSGIIYNATLNYQLPQGIVIYELRSYRITVRVWDSASPVVSLTGAPSWLTATKTFQWDASGVTPAVQVVASRVGVMPHWTVTWQYTATDPSYFMIYRTRNGVKQFMTRVSAAASDAEDPRADWHAWTDRLVPGRAEVTYEVVAFTAGVGTSENNPTHTVTVRNTVPWVIATIDFGRYFCLANPEVNIDSPEVSQVAIPAQGKPYLTIQQGPPSIMGSASGIISSQTFPPETAEDMKNDLLWMKQYPRVWFTWQDQAIECMIYNISFNPIGRADGSTDYAVSFSFLEA